MGTNKRRRHRAWPEALKRQIVAATLLPGSSVSRVARRYDVNANQVFAWRRRYRDGAAEPTELRLLPVTVAPDQPGGAAPAHVGEVIEGRHFEASMILQAVSWYLRYSPSLGQSSSIKSCIGMR